MSICKVVHGGLAAAVTWASISSWQAQQNHVAIALGSVLDKALAVQDLAINSLAASLSMADALLVARIAYARPLDSGAFHQNLSNLASSCNYANFAELYLSFSVLNPDLVKLTPNHSPPGVPTDFFGLGSSEFSQPYVDQHGRFCIFLSAYADCSQFTMLARHLQHNFPDAVQATEPQHRATAGPLALQPGFATQIRPIVYILKVAQTAPPDNPFWRWFSNLDNSEAALPLRDLFQDAQTDPNFPSNLPCALEYIRQHATDNDEQDVLTTQLIEEVLETSQPEYKHILLEDGHEAKRSTPIPAWWDRMQGLRQAVADDGEDIAKHEWVFCHTLNDASLSVNLKQEAREFVRDLPLYHNASRQVANCCAYMLIDLSVWESSGYAGPSLSQLPAELFHQAIFYVGEGALNRPQDHADDAYKGKLVARNVRIRNIWKNGGAYKVFWFPSLSKQQGQEYEMLLLGALTGACGHYLWQHFVPSGHAHANHVELGDDPDGFPFESSRLCNDKFETLRGPSASLPPLERITTGLALLELAHSKFIQSPDLYRTHKLPVL